MRYLTFFFLFFCCSVYAQNDKIFISGCNWEQVALIDKATKQIEWTYDLQRGDDCETVSLTKKGDLLISYKKGAKLINANKEVLWDYKLKDKGELYAATQMPDGGFLLAYSGTPAQIVELDKKGKPVKTTPFDTGVEGVHGQLRQVIKSKAGTYLFPVMGKGEVVELGTDGKEIMRFKVEGNPFSVLELKNGNLLVSCGDAHSILEVERNTGKLIRRIGQKDINGFNLNFAAQIVELNNNNMLICNWNGHAKGEELKQPALIEVNPANQVVWKLYEGNGIGRISCVFAVEDKNLKKAAKYKNK